MRYSQFRLACALAFFVLASLALPSRQILAQSAKRIQVVPSKGAYSGKMFYTNSHAILIGINQYQNLDKDSWLSYAENDVTALRQTLIKSYGFAPENVQVLLGAEATKAKIEEAFSGLSNGDRVKNDDRVLVYFSGHGQTVSLPSGTEMGFLIPFDAKVNLARPENRSGYLQTCIQMDSIWSYLKLSPAKHRLVIADACYGGLIEQRERALRGEKPTAPLIARLLARPALQALTGGGKGEETIESPQWGHGAFTFKLLEELNSFAANSDDVLSISELASALKISVGNLTNGKQNPQFHNHDTEGDFLFVTTSPQAVPPYKGLKHGKADLEPTPVHDLKVDGILLKSTYVKGEEVRYKVSEKIAFIAQGVSAIARGIGIYEVTDATSGGNVSISSHIEEREVEMNGMITKQPDTEKENVTCDPNGIHLTYSNDDKSPNIFSHGLQELIGQLSEPLLSKTPKKIGESWTTEVQNTLQTGKKARINSKFAGIERRNGIDCWKLIQDASISPNSNSAPIAYRMTIYLDVRNGQMEELSGNINQAPTTLGIANIFAELKRVR